MFKWLVFTLSIDLVITPISCFELPLFDRLFYTIRFGHYDIHPDYENDIHIKDKVWPKIVPRPHGQSHIHNYANDHQNNRDIFSTLSSMSETQLDSPPLLPSSDDDHHHLHYSLKHGYRKRPIPYGLPAGFITNRGRGKPVGLLAYLIDHASPADMWRAYYADHEDHLAAASSRSKSLPSSITSLSSSSSPNNPTTDDAINTVTDASVDPSILERSYTLPYNSSPTMEISSDEEEDDDEVANFASPQSQNDFSSIPYSTPYGSSFT